MSEREIKSIALFYFLALLDEKKSIELAQLSIKHLNKQISSDISVDKDSAIISHCFSTWSQFIENNGPIIGSPAAINGSWNIPSQLRLEPWKKFIQTEANEYIFPLIWNEIIKFSPAKIAQGMKISTGTLTTRVAKGLSHLAAHLKIETSA